MRYTVKHRVPARLGSARADLVVALAAFVAGSACTPATPEDMLDTASVMGSMSAPPAAAGSVGGPTGSGPTPGPGGPEPVVSPGGPNSTEPAVSVPEPGGTQGGPTEPGEMIPGMAGAGAQQPDGTGGTGPGGPPATGGSTGGSVVQPGSTGGAPDGPGPDDPVASGGMMVEGVAGAPPAVLGCDWTNPDGRIVLFDGTNLDQWRNLRTGGAAQWQVIGDGSMEVVPLEPPTDIQTAMGFEDLCVHLEYMTPEYPSSVTGQGRGNSGVFLKRAYEMQILDSIGQPPAIDSCGAVYSLQAPLVVACHEELVWNTYEIEFRSSVWDANGTKIENAVFVEATLNGQIIQRDVQLNPAGGFTQAGQPDVPGPQPLMLQDHRNLVRFRNIWVKVPRYQ